MRMYVTAAALAVTAATGVAAEHPPAPAVRPYNPAAAAAPAAPMTGDAIGGEALVWTDAVVEASISTADLPATGAAAPTARKTARVAATGRWRTPEAAMRHLARAYNRADDAALRKVTTPRAREELVRMRAFAPDLRLGTCSDSGDGAYHCTFTHALEGTTRRGSATIRVSPARKQGWYASGLLDCG